MTDNVVEWLEQLSRPHALPAVWLLDLQDAERRQAALAVPPSGADFTRAASRPEAEREDVLVRRGLVRLCVGAALDVPAVKIGISWTPQGAPRLEAPFASYHLSWAQRRSRFACALATRPIGVDIEMADGGEIPWKALHAEEMALLRGAAPSERESLFLRIWAAKEAYGKAQGEGFRREPSSFAVRLGPSTSGIIEDPAARGPRATTINFVPIGTSKGVAAVAVLDA